MTSEIARPDQPVKHHVLCLASAFQWRPSDVRRWENPGWAPMPSSSKEGDGKFLVDQYVPALRDAVFFDGDKAARRYRTTWAPRPFDAVLRPGGTRKTLSGGALLGGELFAFPGGLGIFIVEVDLGEGATLGQLSDVGEALRSFDASLCWSDGTTTRIDRFLVRDVLGGIEIRGDDVDVDEYSGSKLKAFIVAEFVEAPTREAQRHLLYDLGCFVPIGSAGGNGRFSPTPEYHDRMLANAVSVFAGWSAAGLTDAFVAVGHGLLGDGRGSIAWKTWRETYLRIFVLNLHVKFAAQRMSARLDANPAEAGREENAHFIVESRLPRVSYNFLPNLLHQAMRAGLDVQEDLDTLDHRVRTLSKLLDEQRQKRMSWLHCSARWRGRGHAKSVFSGWCRWWRPTRPPAVEQRWWAP